MTSTQPAVTLKVRAEYVAFLTRLLGFALRQMSAAERDEIIEELRAAAS